MILEGLKFGMLLQVAIGPVCMYIFSLGVNEKFLKGIEGVLGVVLADGMYIALAILGISSFIKSESTQKKFKLFGACLVIIFGVEMFLGYFGISLIPKINIFSGASSSLPFFKAFILTAANPMTILFWIGVFSTKINSSELKKSDTIEFALGALLATLLFLTLIVYIGTITTSFLGKDSLRILNSGVGVVLIYFGIKKLELKI